MLHPWKGVVCNSQGTLPEFSGRAAVGAPEAPHRLDSLALE